MKDAIRILLAAAIAVLVASGLGCSNCSDGLHFEGPLLHSGNCRMECYKRGHDAAVCSCSKSCPCWGNR